MSARQFDAALAIHDGDALFRQIYDLTTHNEHCTGSSLPITAADYLRAFCDGSSPAIQRRWTGAALRKMVRTSMGVIEHLKILRHDLTQLGQVILRRTELEETRILAGAIIREAIGQGMEFSQFWPSDKVPNNAPNFPMEIEGWMSRFQIFLDTLGDLVNTDMATDPAILYPVSLVASDGLKWHSDGVGMSAIIQSGVLTIITPDFSTPNLTFVDIPLHHVQSVHTRKSILDDSQARGTKHEPWDLIMALRPSSWTYRVNTSEHMGNEFVMLFENAKDADECRACIIESVNLGSQGSKMSVSQAFFMGSDEASRDQVSSEARGNAHSSRSMHDASATVDLGPEPSGLIEISPTTSSYQDRSSSLDSGMTPEPPPFVEQHVKAPQEADERTIPNIRRPTQTSNSPIEPSVGSGDERDEHDFSRNSQRRTRLSTVSKKGAENAPARHATDATSASLETATKTKPIRNKLTPKPASRVQVEDTEDEEEPISPKPVVRPLGCSLTNGNAAARPTQSLAKSIVPEQNLEISKCGPRLSGLPKISKNVEKLASTNKPHLKSDVWAIPQENETRSLGLPDMSKTAAKATSTKQTGSESAELVVSQHDEQQKNSWPNRKLSLDKKAKDKAPANHEENGRLRTRRTAVKKVNYKDQESSASESNESDYFDTRSKKLRSVVTAAAKSKGNMTKKAAAEKVSVPKPKSGRNKATAPKAGMPPISPEKHSVLASLLHKSRPTPTHEAKERETGTGKASFRQKAPERGPEIRTPSDRESSAPVPAPVQKSDDHVVTFPATGDDQLIIPSKHNLAPEAKVQTVIPLKLNEPLLGSDPLLEEFLDFEGRAHDAPVSLIDRAVHNVHGLVDNTSQDPSGIDINIIAQVSAKPTTVTTFKRKSIAEGPSPSTPRKKRTKTELTGGENVNQAEAVTFKPPTTMSRPRVLSDPTSPLDNQRRFPFQPSIQETVQNLQSLHDEHNSSPALPVVPRVPESHIFSSIKRPQRRNTPLNQSAQRTHSIGSANATILSSNSKPIPASPHAESVAISGHADSDYVASEKRIGDAETARSDPFVNSRSQAPKSTAFIRRLTEEFAGVEEPQVLEPDIFSDRSPERPIVAVDLESPVNTVRDTRRAHNAPKPLSGLSTMIRVRAPSLVKTPRQSVQAPQGLMQEVQSGLPRRRTVVFEDSVVYAAPQTVENIQPQEQAYSHDDGDGYIEGDETLVALAETPASYRASPLQLQSSPPGNYTPSSHSSTSAEPDPESEIPIPTDEAEEMEWEASLQPHQRSVHEQLIRISKNVVRHVVDKETSLDDIAEMYAKDGEHLLNTLVERHSGEFESMLKGVERKKDDMRNEYEALAKRLIRERAKYGPKK